MLSITLGPFALSIDHLLLLLALGLATLVGWQTARRGGGQNPEAALFWLFMLALLVARLAFVAAYWAAYRSDPLQIIDIRDGGFIAWPGLLAGLLGAALRSWRTPALARPLWLGLASGALFWLGSHLLSQLAQQGSQLPGVTLADARGRPVALQSYRGQPLVINLWATWCPPCRREMPALLDAQKRHPNIHFIFVNQGESAQMVGNFASAAGLDLGQALFDPRSELARAIGSSALPTTVFYSAEGTLLGSHMGELSKASLEDRLLLFKAR